jgi:hypothetical protein
MYILIEAMILVILTSSPSIFSQTFESINSNIAIFTLLVGTHGAWVLT